MADRLDRTSLSADDGSLFERVQEVLAMHGRAGEKRRVHNHYLKGSVFCGTCGSRLCLTQAKGSTCTLLLEAAVQAHRLAPSRTWLPTR